MATDREALPDRQARAESWTLEPNAGGHPSLIMVAGRVPQNSIEVVPAAERGRLEAEVETLRGEVFARDGVIKSRDAENERLRERVASLEVYAIVAARSLKAAGLALETDETEASDAR